MARHLKLLERVLKRECYWFTINDNTRRDGSNGPLWVHGRFHIYFGSTSFGLSWSFIQSTFCHCYLRVGGGGDDDFVVGAAIPGIGLWFHADQVLSWKWKRSLDVRTHWFYEGRELGFHIHHNTMYVELWAPQDSHDSRRDRFKRFTIDPIRILFGKEIYRNTVLTKRDIIIPMPEKSYTALAQTEYSEWIRARWKWWPLRKTRDSVQIEILNGGIPIPGKGESDWDCGNDAITGMTVPSTSIEDSIGRVVSSVLTTRRRYGGTYYLSPWYQINEQTEQESREE